MKTARGELGDLVGLADDVDGVVERAVGAGHDDDVAEVRADFFTEVGEDAEAAVAREVGVNDDGGVVVVLQLFDRFPPVGGVLGADLLRLALALDGAGDQRIVFDEQDFHACRVPRYRGARSVAS